MLYKKLISILLVGLLTIGCTAREPVSSSSAAADRLPGNGVVSSASAGARDTVESVAFLPREQATGLVLYLWDSEKELYQTADLPLPENGTLADLAFASGDRLGGSLSLQKITQQKGMIVVDFLPDAPPLIGMGSTEERTLLNSIAQTILQNHASAEWICYRAGGKAYESGHFAFGIDEQYPVDPLRLVDDTPDAYAALRAQIPFPGLPAPEDWMPSPIVTDETGKKLAWGLYLIGCPGKDLEAQDLENDFIVQQALLASPQLSADPAWENYYESLKAFVEPVEDNVMVFKEHAEAAAKLLYGEKTLVRHKTIESSTWRYHEAEGVYTPPHMGGGVFMPFVLSYEKTAEGYRVQCAWLAGGPGGYFDRSTGEQIPEEKLTAYLQNTAARWQYELAENPNGSLRFLRCRKTSG